MIANLSLPLPVVGASLEALSLVRSIPQPLVRERRTRSTRPFALRACSCTSLEALSLVRSITLPLVRARGAHCKTAAHRPKAKRRLSIGEEPSGSGRLRAKPLLILWRGSPKAPRQRQSKWIAHALRANSLAVRAPCAHPRRSNGKALGKALPKTRRSQARRVKGER